MGLFPTSTSNTAVRSAFCYCVSLYFYPFPMRGTEILPPASFSFLLTKDTCLELTIPINKTYSGLLPYR